MPRRRRFGARWPNQFTYEPLNVYQEKERQRSAQLIRSALGDEFGDLPPLESFGAGQRRQLAAGTGLFDKLENIWNDRIQEVAALRAQLPGLPEEDGGGGFLGTGVGPSLTSLGSKTLDALNYPQEKVGGPIFGSVILPFTETDEQGNISLRLPRSFGDLGLGLTDLPNLGNLTPQGYLANRLGKAGLGATANAVNLPTLPGLGGAQQEARQGEQRYKEFMAAPNVPAGAKVATAIGTDPLLYVPVGVVGRLAAKAPGLTGVVRAGRQPVTRGIRGAILGGRYSPAGALLEGPQGAAARLGTVAGGGAGVEAGQRLGGEKGAAAGAILGAVAGATSPFAARAGLKAARNITPETLVGEAPVAAATRQARKPSELPSIVERLEALRPEGAEPKPESAARAGLGPIPEAMTEGQRRLDAILAQHTVDTPQGPRLEMTADELRQAYSDANPRTKQFPGSGPVLGTDDLRFAMEAGLDNAKWYADLGRFVGDVIPDRRELASSVFAITSEKASPTANMAKFFRALANLEDLSEGGQQMVTPQALFERIGEGTPDGISYNQTKKLAELWNTGRTATTSRGALKTPSFGQNTLDAALNQYSPFSTQDRHMAVTLGMNALESPGGSYPTMGAAEGLIRGEPAYLFLDRVTAQLGSELGLQPSEAQAAIWQTIKRIRESPDVANAFDEGKLTFQEAVAQTTPTPGSQPIKPGSLEEALVDPRVQDAMAEFQEAWNTWGLVEGPAADFLHMPKAKGGPVVSQEQGASLREGVGARSPRVNIASKPAGVGREVPLEELRRGQGELLQRIGYDEASAQLADFTEASIPHRVLTTKAAGGWGGPEPNIRVEVTGGNLAKARYMGAVLAKRYEQAGAPQEAIAIELPGSTRPTAGGFDLRKPDGTPWTDAEIQQVDSAIAAAGDNVGWQTVTNDPASIRFTQFDFDSPRELYDATMDVVRRLGMSEDQLTPAAFDSLLLNGDEYDAAIAAGRQAYDPQGVIERRLAAGLPEPRGADADTGIQALPRADEAGGRAAERGAFAPENGPPEGPGFLERTFGEPPAAPVSERRARMAPVEGNTIIRMRGDEIGQAVGADPVDIRRYRQLDDAYRAGEIRRSSPEFREREALRRTWTDEYVARNGRQPVHVLPPGAREEHYARVDQRVQELRNAGFSEDEIAQLEPASQGGSFESYVGRPQAERVAQLERIASDPNARPEMRERARTKLLEEQGINTEDLPPLPGSERFGQPTTDIGETIGRAYLGPRNLANVGGRFAAGTGAGLLEGESPEESLARGAASAIGGAAGRYALRVGNMQHNILGVADDAARNLDSDMRASIPAEQLQLPGLELPKEAPFKQSGEYFNQALDLAHKASRASFTVLTSFDPGSAFIQSAYMAWLHPRRWAKSIGESFQAIPSEKARVRSLNEVRDAIQAVAPPGRGTFFEDAVDRGKLLVSKESQDVTSDVISFEGGIFSGKGPGSLFRATRRQFETQTEAMRAGAFVDLVEKQRAANVAAGMGDVITDVQLKNLAAVANHFTGAAHLGVNPAFSIVFGAPRFLMSQLALVQDAVKGMKPGADVAHRWAAKELGKSLGMIAVATMLANGLMSKGKDWFGPGLGGPDDIQSWGDLKEVLTSSNFGRVRLDVPGLGEADVSLFGPLEPLAKSFFRELSNLPDALVQDPDAKFPGSEVYNSLFYNKASPLFRAILDTRAGYNKYTGETFEDFGDWFLKQPEQFAPIFVQNVSEVLNGEGSWTNAIVEFWGVKSSPLSKYEQTQNIAGALPSEYWVIDSETKQLRPPKSIFELTPKQRNQIAEEYPAVERYLKFREERRDRTPEQVLRQQFEKTQPYWDEQLVQGNLTLDDWRRQFVANQRQLRAIRDQLFEEQEYGAPTTQRGQDLDEYFAIFDDPEVSDESGARINYDAFDQKVRALRSRIGEKRWSELRDVLAWDESPVVNQYQEDMQVYHTFLDTNPKYQGVPFDETRRADDIARRVREEQAAAPGKPSDVILREFLEDGTIDSVQELRYAKAAIGNRYSSEYEQWRRTEEGLRVTSWFRPKRYSQPVTSEYFDTGGGLIGGRRRGRRRGLSNRLGGRLGGRRGSRRTALR